MIKRTLVSLLVALSAVLASATTSYDKNEAPSKEPFAIVIGGKGAKTASKFDSVIGVVYRVQVKYSGDLERIKKYRGFGENFKNKPDLVKPLSGKITDKAGITKSAGWTLADKDLYEADEFICSGTVFEKNKDGSRTIDNAGTINYYFNGSQKMKLSLPVKIKCIVPQDEKFIYFGTIVYEFTGDDFTLKKVSLIDEYEAAQKALNESLGTDKYKLCRVELQ